MNYRSLISFIALGFILFSSIVSGPGCANIVPPQGGERDSLPPVVRKVTPLDSTKLFTGDRINFTFDEYIELDNVQQNLIMSPVPKSTPNVSRKLNTMTVKLRDTLEPNTTYTINFGNTIKDVNEGNVMKNYTYIFSTGQYFDSLQFSGKVILAETGAIDTTLTIILHRSKEDSAVAKEKPRYVTKIDNAGNFRFRNLPGGTYYVYALKDEGGGYQYLNTEVLFAFADSAVQVQQQTRPVTLYAYSAPRAAGAVTPASSGKPKTSADKRLKFNNNLREGKQDLLTDMTLVFEVPLKVFDSTKVHFVTDSTYAPVTGFSWSQDSLKKSLTLRHKWAENTVYHLIFEKDFASDTLGQQLLKADTLHFTSKKLSEYGKVSLKFRNLDLAKNPVLLFLQNNELKESYPLTSATFTRDLFLPGEYNLRILEDRNKNGKWDPGEFFGKRIQPELVKPIERRVVVKANWENEAEIDVNAAPPPPTPEGTRPTGVRSREPGVQRPTIQRN
jgi:hypothetical protein